MIRFSIHYFLLFTLMATVFPYFQLFLGALGFSDVEVGYLLGLTSLAGVCGPIAVGHLADRLRRRRVLILASLAAFAGLLVPLGATGAFWPAAVLAVGIGLSGRTAIPLSDALASTELADPTHSYGRVRLWGSVGFMVTLLAIRATGLVDEGSAGSMMRCMLAGTALCACSAIFLPDRHRARPRDGDGGDGSGAGGFDGLFWLFLLAGFLHQLGMSSYYSFFTRYLKAELGMEQAAWVWAIGPAAEAVVLLYGGRIIRRFGLRAMLLVSMASVTVRLVVYSLVPPLAVILPVQLLHAASFGLFHAASIEFVRRQVPAARRGLAMALYMALAFGLAGWVGSSIGGHVIEAWGYPSLYRIYAAAPLIGIACLALIGRRLDANSA